MANTEVREAAMRTSRGKMGPRSSSSAWSRPLNAFTNKRPYDLTLEDFPSVRDQDLMDQNAYYEASGLMPYHANKKCKVYETCESAEEGYAVLENPSERLR